MNLRLLIVGKARKNSPADRLAADYGGRVAHFLPLKEIFVPPQSGRGSAGEIKDKEGRALLEKVGEKEYLICLDSRGTLRTSQALAQWLGDRMNRSERTLTFAIGGEEGLSSLVLARADETLSLSPMTLPHGLCRVLFLEQLYRALSIIRGHPYHRA